MRDESWLNDLAVAVANAQTPNWETQRERASNEQRRLIDALQLIERVNSAHQDTTLGLDEHSANGSCPERAKAGLSSKSVPVIDRWGGLELLERIGKGSSGRVYRAYDPSLNRQVALKLIDISGSDQSPDDAEREGQLLARIRHQNVATVYGSAFRDGRVGISMEYIRGTDYHHLVQEWGALGDREATLVGIDVARAVAAGHTQGILHRDIKAANVLREEGGRIVLVDFGISQELDQARTGDAIVGTPLYMAPELLAGSRATLQTDIYALGVMLFYLVTGRHPVSGRTAAEIREAHETGEPALLRDLRPELRTDFVDVIEKALDSDPRNRFRTVGEMERALALTLLEETSGALPIDTSTHQQTTKGRRWYDKPRVKWLAALLLLALVMLLVAILWPGSSSAADNPSPIAETDLLHRSPDSGPGSTIV